MEQVFRVCLFITGVINFVPTFLVFLPDKISSAYGIEIPDTNYELLLRHRAVLFGIIGGVMIYSAIKKTHYALSVTMGLISMISFIVLFYLMDGTLNPELIKVMKIDMGGIIILLVGLGLYKFKGRDEN